MKLINELSDYFIKNFDEKVSDIKQIAQGGSDRKYFRLTAKSGKSYIMVFNSNEQENKTFFYYTEILKKIKVNVPEIYHIADNNQMYVIQDLGDLCLLDFLEKNRGNDEELPENVKDFYKKSISMLVKLQVEADKIIDYNKAFSINEFNEESILFDLNYFKYYFLNPNKIEYDELKLAEDFKKLAVSLGESKHKFFMYRDFQARNIMIYEDDVYFIDYQGGRKGAIQYDVASLLYQAKARIPEKSKTELLSFYIEELRKYFDVNEASFKKDFYLFAGLRVLQTLGAYGFRGLIEGKSHFITSISPAINTLNSFLGNNNIFKDYPELKSACRSIIDIKEKYDFNESNELTIRIFSFSYKRRAPIDVSGNGGGFVFDCRGIHNPGRYPEYKSKTGLDKEVIDFFKENTLIDEFLSDALKTVEYNINSYIERGFKSLSIGFGCTGGQHRSVYCVENLANILKNKYSVRILLNHREQGICREL